MTDTSNPKPPPGLSKRAQALWSATVSTVALAAAELELLRHACVALDRCDEAAEVLARDGLVVADRYGSPKQHPAADVETRNKALFARLVAQLGIEAPTSPKRVGRPANGPLAVDVPPRPAGVTAEPRERIRLA
jgi:hypothetical protein